MTFYEYIGFPIYLYFTSWIFLYINNPLLYFHNEPKGYKGYLEVKFTVD